MQDSTVFYLMQVDCSNCVGRHFGMAGSDEVFAHLMTQCPTLGRYPKEILIQTPEETCGRMFMKPLFVVVGSWMQCSCPPLWE